MTLVGTSPTQLTLPSFCWVWNFNCSCKLQNHLLRMQESFVIRNSRGRGLMLCKSPVLVTGLTWFIIMQRLSRCRANKMKSYNWIPAVTKYVYDNPTEFLYKPRKLLLMLFMTTALFSTYCLCMQPLCSVIHTRSCIHQMSQGSASQGFNIHALLLVSTNNIITSPHSLASINKTTRYFKYSTIDLKLLLFPHP